MKKFLLLLVANLFVAMGYATIPSKLAWSDQIQGHATDVKFGDWKQNAPIAAVEDGVYVTGTFDQDMTVGNEFISPVAKSAFLVKYSKDALPLWTVALKGSATINAISADENGVVVAGVFADEVEVGSKDGNKTTITGMADNTAEVSAFILVYDANGNLQSSKVIAPELDEELVNSFMYFPEGGDTYFKPSQVKMVGDKIYLAAMYSANNKISDDLTLKGAVVNVFDFMYMDIASAAVLSFDKNLKNAELVYNVQSAEAMSYSQMEPSSLSFTVADGKVWAAGSGMGSLKVSGKAEGTLEYSMDEEGNAENGMFIIDPDKGVKVFHAQPTSRLNIDNSISYMEIKDGVLNLVGTFSDNLPFDNTKVESTSNAIFYASYDLAEETVLSVAASTLEKEQGEKEVISGVGYADNTLAVFGYVFDQTYGEEKVVKNINFGLGATLDSPIFFALNIDMFVTALDSYTDGEVYGMSASEGKYTLTKYVGEGSGPEINPNNPVPAWTNALNAHSSDVKYGKWNQNAPISAVSDGTVYVTGTFDQDMTIGNELLSPIAKSAFIAKYASDSNVLWTNTLKGAATITAINADETGVVVTGVFADLVVVSSKDGKVYTINGMADNTSEVSAFILVYDADGNLKSFKTIAPELDEELVNSFMYFPEGGDTYFKPTQVQMDGDKIYLAAKYSANNKISDDLTLKGAVVNVFDFMYMDIASAAVLSFDKDLNNAELVYNVQSAEAMSYSQMEPSSLSFTIADGKVWAAGSGMGSLKVSGKAEGTLDYSMDEEGNTENGMFIIDPDKGVKVFHAKPSARMNINNSVEYMNIKDGKMTLVGSFSDNLPFDNTKEESGSNALYSVVYDIANQTVSSAAISLIEKAQNEIEVFTGVGNLADGDAIYGYVLDETYGEEKIVKNLNLKSVYTMESPLLAVMNTDVRVNAIDSKVAGMTYVMSADAGTYTIALYGKEDTEALYNALQDAIAKCDAEDYIGGTAPGYYPESLVVSYKDALAQAKSLTAESSAAELRSATDNLNTAYSALTATTPNPIVEGYYYIVSAGNGPGYSGGEFNYENKLAMYNEAGRVKWAEFDESNLAQVYYFTPGENEGTWMVKNIADNSYIEKGTSAYGQEVQTSTDAANAQIFNLLKEGKYSMWWENGCYMYSLKANHDGPGAVTSGNLSVWGTADEALRYGVNQWYLVPCSEDVVSKITSAKAATIKSGNGKIYNLFGVEVDEDYNGFKVINGRLVK